MKYKLRSSAEMLYVTLFRGNREIITPVIIQLVRENYQPVSPFDLTAVRRKDAVYLAVGLGAFDLYDEVTICLREFYKANLQTCSYRTFWSFSRWTLTSGLRGL